MILQKKACFGTIQNNTPGMNRGLLSNFCYLSKMNHVKFTKECVMCTEKHILVKKMFTNGQNIDWPLQA